MLPRLLRLRLRPQLLRQLRPQWLRLSRRRLRLRDRLQAKHRKSVLPVFSVRLKNSACSAPKRRAAEKCRTRLRLPRQKKQRAEDNRKSAGKPVKVEKSVAEAQTPAPAKVEAEAAPVAEAAAPETKAAASKTSPRKFTPVARPEIKRPEKKKDDKKTGGRNDERADKRRGGKLTVNRALNEDEGARARSLAALKRAREKERRAQAGGRSTPREKQSHNVIVPEVITVSELANRMAEKAGDLVKALFEMDMMVTVNQPI